VEEKELKKRAAVYNPDADKKWAEQNKAHRNYLSRRSNARGFIRTLATMDDLTELEEIIAKRKKDFDS